MAVVPRFCGNCGTPLTPGSPFCGRCGAPVVVPAAPAAPAYPAYQAYPANAAYPSYAYPRAQPARGRIGGGRTTQIAVAAGLIAMLLGVTVVVGILAAGGSSAHHSNCTANCSPKVVTALQDTASYHSSQFGFTVSYSNRWTVDRQDATTIVLATELGSVKVSGSKGQQPLDQAIQGAVTGLPSASYQGVTLLHDIKGAHLADQNGLGQLYSATYVGSNSTAVKVRFAVIAAAKNGVTVVMVAVNEADTDHFSSGMPEGQLFDYMCTEFTWGP